MVQAHKGLGMRLIITLLSLLSYPPSLSPSLSLHYSKVKPLKILSGKGQYLYDENEQPYLDCINNVTHGMLYVCWAQRHSYTPHQHSNQKLVSVSACVLLFHLLPLLPLLPSLSSLPSSLLSPFPHSLSLYMYIHEHLLFACEGTTYKEA